MFGLLLYIGLIIWLLEILVRWLGSAISLVWQGRLLCSLPGRVGRLLSLCVSYDLLVGTLKF
jgi:hypothetical protein